MLCKILYTAIEWKQSQEVCSSSWLSSNWKELRKVDYFKFDLLFCSASYEIVLKTQVKVKSSINKSPNIVLMQML